MFKKIIFIAVLLSLFTPEYLPAIPYFARKFDYSCQTCHLHPPKVNIVGEQFAASGYATDLHKPVRATRPFALWASHQSRNLPARDNIVRGIPNRVELITADKISFLNLSYFIEWRIISQELTRDGNVVDRSGRFEDLFIMYEITPDFQVWLGQFRSLTQIDISRRLSISEPMIFSRQLPGPTASYDRLTRLRGFAPSARSPSIRLYGVLPDDENSINGWHGIITIPFTGEFSIPLTRAARTDASFELELIPKGVFIETFRQYGLSSLGINFFAGSVGRNYASVVGVYHMNRFLLGGSLARSVSDDNRDFLMSGDIEYFHSRMAAFGMRMEHLVNDSANPNFIPYFSVHFPGTTWSVKTVLEGRFGKGMKPQGTLEVSLLW